MPMMRTRNHPGPGELLPPAYYYGVWQINLTRETGVAMPVTFICVLDENDVLVRVTHLQDYIADGDNLTAPYEAYNKKRCLLFAKMLNYILVERRDDYGIDSILDIEKVMMQDFFTDYASMNLPGDHTRAPETSWECVRICTFTMKQLVVQYGSEMKITVQELVKTKTFRDFKGVLVTKEVPNFTAHDMSNDPAREAIFRELPTKAFELLIPLAFRFTPDIAFGLCLGAFAGLRPGEICNVRQECSPWGTGIRFSVDTNGDPIPEIDLRREYALRSDKVSVGKIKKERIQKVYPDFAEAFNEAYKFHLRFLESRSFDARYAPMFINRDGEAMTYDTFADRFEELIQEHFVPALLMQSDRKLRTYGEILRSRKLSPHCLRHFFTVQLVLRGIPAASLMQWRGDRCIESSFAYIMRKDELLEEARKAGKELTEMLLRAVKEGAEHE